VDLSVEFLIPYQSLQEGQEIYFTLFDDAPKFSLSSGVVCSINVQVGKLMDGGTSVQTLIGLVPLTVWQDSVTRPSAQETVPLEFMEDINIEGYHPREKARGAEGVSSEEEVDIISTPIVSLDDVYTLHERKRPEKKKVSKRAKKVSKATEVEETRAAPISLGISRRR